MTRSRTPRSESRGASEFQRGHRLLPVAFETTGAFPAGMQVGSLFFLAPDTSYEVRVVVEDPDDPAPVEGAPVEVRTRAAAPTAASGATIYVSADSGDDAHDGSSAATAVRTIGRGVSIAQQGDTVLVAPGVYHEAPEITVSGSATAPIGSARTAQAWCSTARTQR